MARPNTEAEAARRWGDDGRSRYAGGFVSVRTLWIGGFSGLPAGGGEWACGEMNSPKYRGLTVGKSAPSCATRGAPAQSDGLLHAGHACIGTGQRGRLCVQSQESISAIGTGVVELRTPITPAVRQKIKEMPRPAVQIARAEIVLRYANDRTVLVLMQDRDPGLVS